MLDNRWDLFSSKTSPGSLWFAFQAARCLVDRRQSVRLFTDDTASLSSAVNDIDPKLWLQRHGGIDIIDSRLASQCSASPNLLQFFSTDIPQPYLARFVTQQSRPSWVRIEGCGTDQNAAVPLRVIESSSTLRRYVARIGDPPQQVGYVKQRHHSLLMRQRWSQKKVRHSLLSVLGLPLDLLDNRLIVYMAGTAQMAAAPWTELFATQRMPATVFVEHGGHHAAICKALGLAANAIGLTPVGSANFVFLPALQWFIADELLGIADVVFTDLPDVATRASECGAPLIWGGSLETATEFTDWYARGLSGALRSSVIDAFAALRTGAHIGQAWQWYLNSIFDISRHAGVLSTRMQRGADMTDVLLAGLGDQFPSSSPEQFSPTQPHRLVDV